MNAIRHVCCCIAKESVTWHRTGRTQNLESVDSDERYRKQCGHQVIYAAAHEADEESAIFNVIL